MIKGFIKLVLALIIISFILGLVEEIEKNPMLGVLIAIIAISLIGLVLLLKNKSNRMKKFKFLRRYKGRYKGLIACVAILTMYLVSKVELLKINLYHVILVALALMITLILIIYLYKKHKKDRIFNSGIDKVDLMTGEDFEKYLEILFEKKGYNAQRTPLSGDFGADLIIEKEIVKTAVQAKRYNDKVGLQAVQEVVAAMAHYKCMNGMVITNNYFTQQAKDLAESNKIILWDRDELINQILDNNKLIGKAI